jgi:multiple antibiotic resistance protein
MSSFDLLVKFPAQLFCVLTPVAAIAALVGMTPNSSARDRVKISIEASCIAFGILLFAAVLGPLLFAIFNISNDSFRVAGGVYLLLIGIDLLAATGGGGGDANSSNTKGRNIAITPLAMPLLSGPGTISYVLLQRSQVHTAFELLQFFIGIFFTMALVAACFIIAAAISNAISKNTVKLCEKLTGLIIVCIGAQVLATSCVNIFCAG